MRWIVDGMNLMGSRPDGWWRDRAAARERLVTGLAGLRTRTDVASLVVVFDGRGRPREVADGRATGVDVVFAPGGPDAADRVIAAMVAASDDAAGTTVVTSDAALAAQVRAGGASVMGVSAFRRLLGDQLP